MSYDPVVRKRLSVARDSIVSIGSLPGEAGFPAVVEPAMAGVDLAGWCTAYSDLVSELLMKHAAILFRGFGIANDSSFRKIAATSGNLLDYRERAAPRREISKGVYTSTEFDHNQCIPLHHEMSYSRNWPQRIWFFCLKPAPSGGCTPIADDRKVLPQLPADIRQRFERSGVMYVRNYGQGGDLPWQEAFQTSRRTEVEDYCKRSGMTCEWREEDRLRTRYVGAATVRHPRTGDSVWFNHAHMFHSTNLQLEVRRELLAQFSEEELPRNVFFGDGSRIEDSTLETIRAIYDRSAVRFPWQHGDALLLDNVLASHGRDPFQGDRTILVAMTGVGMETAASSF